LYFYTLCPTHCWTGHSAVHNTVSLSDLRCNALYLFRDYVASWNHPNSIEFVIAICFQFFVCCVLKSLIPQIDQWPYLPLPPLKEKFVQCLFKVFFFIIDKLISKYFHCYIRSICFWKRKLSFNSSFPYRRNCC